jgi:hypothetical protein
MDEVIYEVIEEITLPEEMNITFRFPSQQTLRIPIKTDTPITTVRRETPFSHSFCNEGGIDSLTQHTH